MKEKLLTCLRVVLAGILVGLIISLFQYLTHLVINLGAYLINTSALTLSLMYLIGAIIYTFIYIVNRKYPGYSGSGLPQLEAYYEKHTTIEPLRMLLLIFINSIYSFFVGLPLGAEGPSISISGSLALYINKLFKVDDDELSMASGSAGFACAFSNPIAGIFHLIEENRRNLNISLFIKGIFILAISYLVNYFLIDEPLLPFIELKAIPLIYYLYLLLIIIIALAVAKLFSYLVVKAKRISRGNKRVLYLTALLIILFITLRRIYPILTGSGLSLLNYKVLDYSLLILIGFLLFRVLTTSLSVSAYLSGGIVLPTLSIGGLVGFIVVKLVSLFDPSILEYGDLFMLVGMFTFLSILTRCPLTALFLGLGCASFEALFVPLALTILASFIISSILKYNSIYHDLKKEYLSSLGIKMEE